MTPEAMAFRRTLCNTCEDKFADCIDCHGEGSWDTACETCGEVRALSEGNHCANCLGLTEVFGDPFGRRFAA